MGLARITLLSTPIFKRQHFLAIEPDTEQAVLYGLEKLSWRFEILFLLMNHTADFSRSKGCG